MFKNLYSVITSLFEDDSKKSLAHLFNTNDNIDLLSAFEIHENMVVLPNFWVFEHKYFKAEISLELSSENIIVLMHNQLTDDKKSFVFQTSEDFLNKVRFLLDKSIPY